MAEPRGERNRLIVEVTDLIRQEMGDRGVSRAQLAARLGVSRAHVTKLLDGETNMTLGTVADVLRALDARLLVEAEPIMDSSKS
jgi:plasmid maintenance system antidote protein VapI